MGRQHFSSFFFLSFFFFSFLLVVVFFLSQNQLACVIEKRRYSYFWQCRSMTFESKTSVLFCCSFNFLIKVAFFWRRFVQKEDDVKKTTQNKQTKTKNKRKGNKKINQSMKQFVCNCPVSFMSYRCFCVCVFFFVFYLNSAPRVTINGIRGREETQSFVTPACCIQASQQHRARVLALQRLE